MKLIPLTQGQVAKVSDEWYEELNKYKWQAQYCPHTKSYYAVRTSTLLGKQKMTMMHRVIAGTPDGMETDHKDGDTLNNLPDNLRNSTHAQNGCNRGKDVDNASGFKGVRPHGKNWQAIIGVDGKTICLHTFKTREDAARAYDEAAKKYHGKFARLNFEE
jgi:hypothetical protein